MITLRAVRRLGTAARLLEAPSRALSGATKRCFGAAAHVGQRQLRQYEASGFCIPSYRLSLERTSLQRAALARLLDANPGVRPEDLVNAHLASETPGGAVAGDTAFLELGRDPALTGIVAELLGTPSVLLWACHVFCKPAGVGRRVPFHQDGQYWPIEPLRATTLWVALDDSDVENGCLRVVPGSHFAGELPHDAEGDDAVLQVGIPPKFLESLAPAEPIELEAGQVSAHDAMLAHGSEANRSDRRRAGIAYHYMDAMSHFDRTGPKATQDASAAFGYDVRPLLWVRGSSIHPQNTLVQDWRPNS